MSDFPYWTAARAAEHWQTTQRVVERWFAEGRVPTAFKVANRWVVPEDTPRPNVPPPGRPKGA